MRLYVSAVAMLVVAGCNSILGIGTPHGFGSDANSGNDGSVDAHADGRPSDAAVDARSDAPVGDAPVADAPLGYLIDLAADVGVHTTANGVASWDDQSGHAYNATTATANGPLLTTAVVNSVSHPVLRFDGTNYLVAAPHVPPTGTLFVVYSNASHSTVDIRLVGWEDTAVGQHGLALIPDYNGANINLLVARDNGASGDIQGGPAVTGMEIAVVSWGSTGVTFDRRLANGQTMTYSSNAIQAISDGGLSLRVGGPGDQSTGVSPFIGDLAALRVYDRQLSSSERAAVLAGFVAHWL